MGITSLRRHGLHESVPLVAPPRLSPDELGELVLRLKARVAELESKRQSGPSEEDIRDMLAEIKRLGERVCELTADIERLRSALDESAEECGRRLLQADQLRTELEAVKAENAKLHAELEAATTPAETKKSGKK
jgi:regulator of replication initiation timing